MHYGPHRGLWLLDAAALLYILSINSIPMHVSLKDRCVDAVSNAFLRLNSKFTLSSSIAFEVSETIV